VPLWLPQRLSAALRDVMGENGADIKRGGEGKGSATVAVPE